MLFKAAVRVGALLVTIIVARSTRSLVESATDCAVVPQIAEVVKVEVTVSMMVVVPMLLDVGVLRLHIVFPHSVFGHVAPPSLVSEEVVTRLVPFPHHIIKGNCAAVDVHVA